MYICKKLDLDSIYYRSTRDSSYALQADKVIAKGLANDGGLFVPDRFPKVSLDPFLNQNYEEITFSILSLFLPQCKELKNLISKAYQESQPVAIHHLDSKLSVLELFHGKSSAFKDVALQLLPYLLTDSLKSIGETRKAVILTATSGDTGSSAMAGFAGIPNTEVIVFYPNEGISQIQRLQMTTQEGANVHAIAIKGNFDDAQTAVKELFLDANFTQEFNKKYLFTSANSINVGRLLPQIVYYFYSYAQLVKCNRIKSGQKVNFTVPTGNFGNILAGYYAKKIGLPINKIICATNQNSVIYDFFQTGQYNRCRTFYKTLSPSMDILISSNFERLVYHYGNDSLVKKCQKELNERGIYSIPIAIWTKMKECFYAACLNDSETESMIKETYTKFDYLLDPHSAVAMGAMEKYQKATHDNTYQIVLATASPYKFPDTVEKAIGQPLDESGLPDHLKNLQHKKVLHHEIVDKQEVRLAVRRILSR